LWRGSIGTNQDRFPITTVGNDRDRDGVPIAAVGHNHSLLSSPQVVGGDPSGRKPKMDSRQKQAGMTMTRKTNFSLIKKNRENPFGF
jgi:hypothetical protein